MTDSSVLQIVDSEHRRAKTADDAGMVVIVNYFYWQHARRFKEKSVIKDVTAKTTDRLLETGYENILVDIVNESAGIWEARGIDPCAPEHVHELIDVVKGRSVDGRRLLVGVSSSGGLLSLPYGKWLDKEDFSMPHGNGCTPEILKMKIQAIHEEDEYKKRPRPILVNEDSIFVENLEAAVDEYASWGFYCQGYGSEYRDRMNWKTRDREVPRGHRRCGWPDGAGRRRRGGSHGRSLIRRRPRLVGG